ncbi:hypothetical protein HanPI659440_Chr10g0373871 [Helianthus annuus]|nr:hypothetical protein HanPI659440_Chr10g0373871 [Helianthus annuus]
MYELGVAAKGLLVRFFAVRIWAFYCSSYGLVMVSFFHCSSPIRLYE